MNIRIATLNDLDSIVDIYNQAIQAGQKTAYNPRKRSGHRYETFKSAVDKGFYWIF